MMYSQTFTLTTTHAVKRWKFPKTRTYPAEWREVDFPITMAKPEIMQATTRAMALKIFDQFGILPAEANRTGPRPKGDPLVVAQIIDPRPTSDRRVTFMIAWHLDTRVL